MKKMREVAMESFVERMMRHLEECFPVYCKKRGVAERRDLIQNGIEKADSYGIEKECDVARYIDLTVVLGAEFVNVPETRWTGGILRDSGASADFRLNEIFRRIERNRSRSGMA